MHLLVRWTTVIPSFLEYPKTLQRMLQLVLCSWWGNQIAYHYYDQTQYCCHINWQQTRFITRCVWQIDSVKLVVPVTCRSSRISSSGYTALTLYHLLLQWHRYFLRSRRSLNYYCFSHLFSNYFWFISATYQLSLYRVPVIVILTETVRLICFC